MLNTGQSYCEFIQKPFVPHSFAHIMYPFEDTVESHAIAFMRILLPSMRTGRAGLAGFKFRVLLPLANSFVDICSLGNIA